MIDTFRYTGEGFLALKEFEGWKIGILRHSERFSRLSEMECHLETDEVFVLLEGTATLYTEDEICPMEYHVLYSVRKGEWHHIVVSEDATVLVMENSNTSIDNTQKKGVEVHADK